MLDELLERAVRALDELEGLFNGAKNYFSETIDGIVREFLLKEKDISELVMLKKYNDAITRLSIFASQKEIK